ncbi:ParB/RepB/Spo0J family partition protein [Saccharomonospora piscinae]|uniref:ParB/RepB/Spo0J family partition protein n=1 Tax=Saccharomonospora piscinae TaxID=687388 RepID=UPI00110659BA|nr:ParB/RepB/Spo0J family partition protein [Saccharomonospora piscinae]TLW89240.1 ParB/RepB/Spo0J family partition protein [Saccharomonospora piscinae]
MGRRRRIEGSALATTSAPATVPVTSIAHNPRNPRDDYDDVGELADSIREVGVLQPIGVVRYEVYLSHYPDHELEVGTCDWVALNGNRRLAAARRAGVDEIPVHVLDRLGREDHLDESVLIENIHREQLPPLREAQAIRLLVDRHGSQRAVAKRIGKSQGYISQRLSLLKLTPQLQDALRSGQMTVEDARRVAALPAEEQQESWQRIQSGDYAVITPAPAPPAAPPVDDHAPSDYGVITHDPPVGEDTPRAGGRGGTGDYAVITPGSTNGHHTNDAFGDYGVITQPPPAPAREHRTIAVDSPQQVASALRQHFTTPQLEELAQLLLN